MGREAIKLAREGFCILPIHSVQNGKCSCGNPNCKDPGKHPCTEHGVKDATLNIEQINDWWDQWPDANIGIATGRKSGLIVLDEDPRHGGSESLVELEKKCGPIRETRRSITGNGEHYYFQHPGGSIRIKNAQPLEGYPGIDVRGDGGYVVAPPSLHKNGKRYRWDETSPEELAPIPPPLLDLLLKNPSPKMSINEDSETITEGSRNSTLASFAGSMRNRRMTEAEILPTILSINSNRCNPPLDESEVEKIVRSIAQYPPGDSTRKEGRSSAMTRSHKHLNIEQLEERFQRRLLLGDRFVIKVVIASVVANRLDGDPLWLFLVGPPSGAKTELLGSLGQVPLVHPLSDLTTHTFASGMKGSEDASLLPKLDYGTILVLKDFTTVLSMPRDSRAVILSQLREIYDGSYTKAFGTGKKLEWKGKLGLIAGVTPILDTHYSIFNVLGERFVQYRIQQPDPVLVAKRAIDFQGKEAEMREDLAQAMHDFYASLKLPCNPKLLDRTQNRIANLAAFCVKARSSVVRSPYGNKDIIYVPEAEAPPRLAKQLATFTKALVICGVKKDPYAITRRLALHGIPKVKLAIISVLNQEMDYTSLEKIALNIRYSQKTTRRYLDELYAFGITQIRRASKNRSDRYALSDNSLDQIEKAELESSLLCDTTVGGYE